MQTLGSVKTLLERVIPFEEWEKEQLHLPPNHIKEEHRSYQRFTEQIHYSNKIAEHEIPSLIWYYPEKKPKQTTWTSSQNQVLVKQQTKNTATKKSTPPPDHYAKNPFH